MYGDLFEEEILTDTAEEPCYLVIDPGSTGLKKAQMILETEAKLLPQYDTEFKSGVGAEAVREILRTLDVQTLARSLRKELKEATGQKRRKSSRDYKSSNPFVNQEIDRVDDIGSGSGTSARFASHGPVRWWWFATSDLNDLYRRVINRNNRLKRLPAWSP